MTSFDLRLAYKKDTGNSPNTDIIKEIEIDGDTTISELSESIDIEIDLEMDEIPYVLWLEEQLIYERNKNKKSVQKHNNKQK